MDHNKLWKILKEIGIPDHLTCLLRNLYAGQEATVRTGHGTADWFQLGKGVCQGCILSPCLFNFYAEYVMRNAGLEEAQAGIKIAASKQAPAGTRGTCFGKQIQKRVPHAPKSQRSLLSSLQGPHQLRTTEAHVEEHTSASDAAGARGISFQNRPGPCRSLRRGSGRKAAKPCQTSISYTLCLSQPQEQAFPP